MNSSPLKPSGLAFIYTFPFLVYVDSSSQIKIKEIIFNGKTVRIYPLFRSGKANFVPMPPVEIQNIPFIDRLDIYIPSEAIIPLVSAIPSFDRDENGMFHLLVSWGEKFEKVLKIMPMDSLRIDVLERNESSAEIISNSCSFQLIQLIRQQTKQWWIEHYTNASVMHPVNQAA